MLVRPPGARPRGRDGFTVSLGLEPLSDPPSVGALHLESVGGDLLECVSGEGRIGHHQPAGFALHVILSVRSRWVRLFRVSVVCHMETQQQKDAAAVRVFPPGVPLLTTLTGVGLSRLWPIYLGFEFPTPTRCICSRCWCASESL